MEVYIAMGVKMDVYVAMSAGEVIAMVVRVRECVHSYACALGVSRWVCT